MAGWTDHFADWSLPSKMTGYPTGNFVEALVSAINERLKVINYPVIEYDKGEATLNYITNRTTAGTVDSAFLSVLRWLSDDDYSDGTPLSLVDFGPTDVAPIWARFANHNLAVAGEFTGNPASIPVFTPATVVSDMGSKVPTGDIDNAGISAGTHFFVYPGSPVTAEAIHYCYKIIKNCVWHVASIGQLYGTNKKEVTNKNTYQEIIDNWPGSFNTVSPTAFYTRKGYDGQYDVVRAYPTSVTYSPSTTDFNYDVDLYLNLEVSQAGDIFDDEGGLWSGAGYNRAIVAAANNGNHLFDLLTGLPSGAPPDPGIVFYVDDYGNPNGPYSGSITSITIDFPADPGTFYPTGNIELTDWGAKYDWFAYTAVSGSGTSRTFTVNTTLSSSYDAIDNANAYSAVSQDPDPANFSWSSDSTAGAYVSKWNVASGFDYT